VSGHDFSHAERNRKNPGFNPRGILSRTSSHACFQ
jgi:hypothetical protein